MTEEEAQQKRDRIEALNRRLDELEDECADAREEIEELEGELAHSASLVLDSRDSFAKVFQEEFQRCMVAQAEASGLFRKLEKR